MKARRSASERAAAAVCSNGIALFATLLATSFLPLATQPLLWIPVVILNLVFIKGAIDGIRGLLRTRRNETARHAAIVMHPGVAHHRDRHSA